MMPVRRSRLPAFAMLSPLAMLVVWAFNDATVLGNALEMLNDLDADMTVHDQ